MSLFAPHPSVSPPPSRISHGLRGQFMFMAALLLSLACITLGWFLIHQQIHTVMSGLSKTGILLGKHLAANSRYSMISGDDYELNRLARGILAAKDVSYVSFFTADGRPMISVGREQWEHQLSQPPTAVSPINPALSSLSWDDPSVGHIYLKNGSIEFSPEAGFPWQFILTLLSGRNVDLLYNISIPIRPNKPKALQDSSLGLLFDQHEEAVSYLDETSQPLLGIIEIGMSSLSAQEQLRTLIWQAIAITGLILLVGVALLSFFSYRITSPLRRLTDAANRVAEGETRIDLPTTAAGEIGGLTHVFSHMLHSIHERESALQDLNQTLEFRIAARTEELRRANQKLKELDRRKSLFVSAASHEIKTPLTSITCHLDNLLFGVDGPLSKEQVNVLKRVQANIERLEHLLVDLLDLCKIELGETTVELHAINAESVIAQSIDSLQSFASRRGMFIDMEIPPRFPLVAANTAKLHQIMTNLIHNALKFSPDCGTVRITGQVHPDGFARIGVHDSGCGIAPQEIGKVFDPFYSAKHIPAQKRGTGLGLAITKQLVTLHHGRIWVESEIEQGTSFFFTLPLWPQPPLHENHQSEPLLLSKQSVPYDNPDLSGLSMGRRN